MYSHEQLKLMDAAAISISSQRHIQSVIEELIETAIAAAQTPAEAPSVPDGWIRAIDEAMVVHHIGIADRADSYEVAKKN